MDMLKVVYLGKHVGDLRVEDRVFIAKRNEWHHYFRKFKGLGMSFGLLMKLEQMGCKKIIFLYERVTRWEGTPYNSNPLETEVKPYYAKLQKFIDSEKFWRDSRVDYQRILSLAEMEQRELKVESD